MPRFWVNTTLFLSSYLPLFALVGIRSIDRSCAIAWACGVLSILAIIGTAAFLVAARKRSTITIRLTDVEARDADVAAYAATYLLPFVTVFTGKWQDILSLTGFIAVLGVIYVRSRLIYINPTLALLGYHLARVLYATPGAEGERQVRWPRYVLARQVIRSNETIRVHEASRDLLVLAKPDG